jgi:hypothetical protein
MIFLTVGQNNLGNKIPFLTVVKYNFFFELKKLLHKKLQLIGVTCGNNHCCHVIQGKIVTPDFLRKAWGSMDV